MSLPDTTRRARSVRRLQILITLLCYSFLLAEPLSAGGPRWVTGPPFFTQSGTPVVWYTNQPLYFTDPGDLSPTVNHAAADAIVAAAAAVWNAPTDSLVLAQGGTLNEHVSGANAFLGSSGPIFPADVQSSSYLSKQIAVIYDTDGSITDLLLGDGASDPTDCLQSGVTESVDSIVPAGFIQHAILILNGRCTGPAPQQQLQLQYQLMRAFGRVLGLGWSQTNDNVFTQSPQPTANQALHWPVMHPIDIICGLYTYACMQQPFTLRPDDLSALAQLYMINQGQAPAGKIDSLLNANQLSGRLQFPTGQGMQGVNVVGRRWQQFTSLAEAENWYTASSVSGYLFRQSNGNPVVAQDTSLNGSQGTTDPSSEGFYSLGRVPMLPGSWQVIILDTEPVNPLYTGQYAVGPYVANTVDPSGEDLPQPEGLYGSYSQALVGTTTTASASSCNTQADGTEAAPTAVNPQGWWLGLICGYGHTAWSSFSVTGNRSLTVEVTAQDEQGFATMAKAMPVIGIWNATDARGSLPGVAAASQSFNGLALGMTTLTASFTQPDQLRLAIADQRGDGRPDFNYQARVLYADSLSPSTVSAAGGTIKITGTGFRTGNTVTVNGVDATVSSWTANAIVATVPSIQALGAGGALTADVTVQDLSTGGTTVMTQSLTYAGPPAVLSLLSAPSGTVVLAQPASPAFAVQVLSSDGITPIVGEAVTFTATAGTVLFAACGATACTVNTDPNGIASTVVIPQGPGAITLQASGVDGTAFASFTAINRIQTITAGQPVQYIAANATVEWTPQVTLADNFATTAGQPVHWSVTAGPASVTPSQTAANSQGIALTLEKAGPLTPGAQAVVSACAWATVCTTLTTQGVDPANLRLMAVSGDAQTVASGSPFAPVVLRVLDPASHPVAGTVVQIYQTIDAWQPPCPDRGRCPIPPVLASSQNSLTSDANGLVTIVPDQLPGTAGTTNLAAATGTQGFLSLTLQTQP